MIADIIVHTSSGSSILGTLKWLLIIAGLVAIVLIAVKAMGYIIPEWFIKILFVVLIVVVAVLALEFLAGL